MSILKTHKADAERILAANPDLKGLVRKQFEIIIELCEAGLKLEAENADLRNQLRDALERC